MRFKPTTDTAPPASAARFAVQSEVLRLSAQPSGPVLLVQFLLDCGVAALFSSVVPVTCRLASFVAPNAPPMLPLNVALPFTFSASAAAFASTVLANDTTAVVPAAASDSVVRAPPFSVTALLYVCVPAFTTAS